MTSTSATIAPMPATGAHRFRTALVASVARTPASAVYVTE
jgi:hypothetical protein